MAKWVALAGSLLVIAVAAITWEETRPGSAHVSSPGTTSPSTATSPPATTATAPPATTAPSSPPATTAPSSQTAPKTATSTTPATTSSQATATSPGAQGTTPATTGGQQTAPANPPSSITWRITGTYTTPKIDNAYGISAVARGVYLVVNVVASNATAQTIALDGDFVDLQLAGTKYPLETAAISALELAGHRTLPPTLKAGETASGSLVFDVPPGAASSAPVLCLGPTLAAGSSSAGCSS